jgi:hypothetical protein
VRPDEIWFGEIQGRAAGTAGWSVLPDGADDPYPSVPGLLSATYVQGQRVKCVSVGGDPQFPQIVDRGRRQWFIAPQLDKRGFWLIHRYDQQRTGDLGGAASAPTLGSATPANSIVTRFLRAMNGLILQVGPTRLWSEGGVEQYLDQPVTQLVCDITRGRLYALINGVLTAYAVSDITSPLNAAGFNGVSLEPLLVTVAGDSKLWVPVTGDTSSWAWKALDPDQLDAQLASVSMAWDGWSAASEMPNTSAGVSYPIMLTTLPLYGHEASISPNVQPMISSHGHVIPGDDDDFIAELQTQRADIHSFEDLVPHNYGWVNERSQVLAFDLSIGSRVWSFPGWGASRVYEGITPVISVGDRIIAHWERATFDQVTFAHSMVPADIGTYVSLWQTPFGINSDHTLAPALDGDLQANRTLTWVGDSASMQPWPDDAPAPTWAYDRAEIDGLVSELLAYLQPAFSAPLTRDVQKKLEHGMVAIDAASGAELARSTNWNDSPSTYSDDTDSGDPNRAPHGTSIPGRKMFTGEVRQLTVTLAPNASSTLHEMAGLADDEIAAALVAVETLTGDDWLGVDGNHHTVYYQGHLQFAGLTDGNGDAVWSECSQIYRDDTDSVNHRWSHVTSSVEYHLWIIKRRPVVLEYASPKYGFDPYNARTDGQRIFLLPRRCPPTVTPLIQQAYYPPGTTFDHDGIWNFQLHFSGIFADDHFYAAGWHRGPFLNASFSEFQTVNDYITNQRFAGHDIDHPWTTRGCSQYAPDAKFVFRHASPFLHGPDPTADPSLNEVAVLNEYGNDSPYRWEFEVPAYGYWFLGGDPLDRYNWVPVDYNSPQTLFQGVRGGKPSGGVYRFPPADEATLAPQIPSQDDPGVGNVLVALDAATLAESWRLELGAVKLAATPAAAIAGGRLYLWVPGNLLQVDPATGTVLADIGIPDSESWRYADLIVVDGRIYLAGDCDKQIGGFSGRIDVTA